MRRLILLLSLLLCALPCAAITQEEKTACVDQASAATSTCTLTATNSGELIVVIWTINANRTLSSVTDDAGTGNTYQAFTGVDDIQCPNQTTVDCGIWYSVTDQTDAGPTITITLSWGGGNSGGADVFVARYSDADGWPANPEDGFGSGGVTSGTSMTTGSITTTGSELVAVCGLRFSGNRTVTPGGGFVVQAGGGSDEQWMEAINVSGSQECSATWSGNINGSTWAAVFKTNTAGGAPTSVRRPPVVWQ